MSGNQQLPAQTQVLIVGAGPAGLSAANTLLTLGFSDFVIVDKLVQGMNTSRAAAVVPRTLEVLETIGCAERLVPKGHHTTQVTLRTSLTAKPLAHVPSSVFASLPSKYPFGLVVSQHETERVLAERLRELGKEIVRPKVVIGVRDRKDGLAGKEVTFESGEVVNARYVIGADGSHSVVRSSLSIDFKDPGSAGSTSFLPFLVLADVHLSFPSPSPLPNEALLGFVSPYGLFLLVSFIDGSYRFIAEVRSSEPTPPKELTTAYLQSILNHRLYGDENRNEGVTITDIIWSSKLQVRDCVADKFFVPADGTNGRGGVVLIGDASHIHSPAGGQGMNLGIRDGVEMGHALLKDMGFVSAGTTTQQPSERTPLASKPQDSSTTRPLEELAIVRREIAVKIIHFTNNLTWFATLKPGWRRTVVYTLFWIAAKIPMMQKRMVFNISALQWRKQEKYTWGANGPIVVNRS